jgi:hypothetical protein
MLTTLLENKVRGGKWHTLYDKVMSRQNLYFSAMKVIGKKGAAGVDRQTVDEFLEQRWPELDQLQQELLDESYRPYPVRRVEIPKPGSNEKRPLGIPTVAAYCTSFNRLYEFKLGKTLDLLRLLRLGLVGTVC